MKECMHAIGGKINEIGETLCFCELTDNLENVTLGDCLGNCEAQESEKTNEWNSKEDRYKDSRARENSRNNQR